MKLGCAMIVIHLLIGMHPQVRGVVCMQCTLKVVRPTYVILHHHFYMRANAVEFWQETMAADAERMAHYKKKWWPPQFSLPTIADLEVQSECICSS